MQILGEDGVGGSILSQSGRSLEILYGVSGSILNPLNITRMAAFFKIAARSNGFATVRVSWNEKK